MVVAVFINCYCATVSEENEALAFSFQVNQCEKIIILRQLLIIELILWISDIPQKIKGGGERAVHYLKII